MSAASKIKSREKIDRLEGILNTLSTASTLQLEAWNAFIKEVDLPAEIYPALMTGRVELLNLIQPKALSAEDAKVVFTLIGVLIQTNVALKTHAEQLSIMVGQWAGGFKHLESLGQKVQDFASFTLYRRDDDAGDLGDIQRASGDR